MDKIYTSFNTILEMLQDRGIELTEHVHAAQIDKFISTQANKLGFEIQLKPTKGGEIRVVYYLAPKFKWSELKKFFEDEDTKKYELTLLIVRDKIGQSYLKQLADLELQIFLLKELQFNPSKHILVPKHERISNPQEIKEIKSQYSVETNVQFPTILSSDVMARWLHLRPGDLVKVTRPSPTAGFYVQYRCCV